MYNEGDIITLAFDEERYLLAKVIKIEKLTLHDLTHLLIYDTTVTAGPGGYDVQGEYQERSHELPDVSALSVAVDHIALTATAFEESDPMAIGHEEVTGEELKGYAVWVAMRRERAEARGLYRTGSEDEGDEEYEGDDGDEGEEGDEGEGVSVGEEEGVAEGEAVTEVEAEAGEETAVEVEVRTHTWHDTVFDVSLSRALIELSDVFKREEFSESRLAHLVRERVEADAGEINALVRQLVDEGDYGAGQELLVYGDPAADALNAELIKTSEQQTVEDILQILGDMGSDHAYGHIARFFESRFDELPDNPIAVAAARSFCYVVMLTGGTPEPLQSRLKMIEELDYPELRDDAEAAIAAIRSQGTEVPEGNEGTTSKDPFGGL